MTTYFISDIHLHATSQAQSQLLSNFLQTRGSNADAIYILGDLFALWLGDDLNEPYSLELIKELRVLAQNKIPLYFMPGNRDFLVGEKFCNDSGCKLLPDPKVIDLYGEKVLITHGDMLCTNDKQYQRFRKIVQNKFIKKIFLALPKKHRYKLGLWVKNKVQQTPKDNNRSIYDVTMATVNDWFKIFDVSIVIHGHTHQAAIYKDNGYKRIVLGDWQPNNAQILAVTKHEKKLLDLTSSSFN